MISVFLRFESSFCEMMIIQQKHQWELALVRHITRQELQFVEGDLTERSPVLLARKRSSMSSWVIIGPIPALMSTFVGACLLKKSITSGSQNRISSLFDLQMESYICTIKTEVLVTHRTRVWALQYSGEMVVRTHVLISHPTMIKTTWFHSRRKEKPVRLTPPKLRFSSINIAASKTLSCGYETYDVC